MLLIIKHPSEKETVRGCTTVSQWILNRVKKSPVSVIVSGEEASVPVRVLKSKQDESCDEAVW